MATSESHTNESGFGAFERRDTFNGILWTHTTTALELEATRWGRATSGTVDTDEYYRLVARDGDSFEEVARVPVGHAGREQSGKAAIVEKATEWMRDHMAGHMETTQ